ncbi:dehydrogenase-like isoform X1 [Acyrthosiphon pisum]|uniref:ACYPI001909 protein n=1 Tax=Acyrthosiphon pisum TaxID=7029 RepID=C4WSH0_ACYPI|nr:dehydrogenase-like [Acyrthosiphon pisum]XP_008178126.1 dehydrogenase-like isoform X1 [Acyrthosiphon pisum]BAH70840.1 ACYPI001909 [Acyrthosiphon pisum]|eukprot:NP_001155449.1 dehydrogenase-like [Acyrthosiphon pisum]
MGFLSFIGLIVVLKFLVYFVLFFTSDSDLELWFYDKFKRNLDSFKDKVVWITGASSGIGEHIALNLSKHGAKLVLSARSKDKLYQVKNHCIELSEGKLTANDILVLPMDVTNISKHNSLFDNVISHFGKLDILVNNAGRSQRAVWEDIELGVDRELFDLNVFPVINLSRIAVRYFNQVGSGQLVATSSIAGIIPAPFSATYDATKHALHGYLGALRLEKLHSNIHITLLCPGPVFSNFLKESFTGQLGEKYGLTHSPTDNRMSTERCAHLSCVAIANKLKESWMAKFPFILILYCTIYYPVISYKFYELYGYKAINKLRDNQ